jgi:isopenicillin N synthase-like dioxygenase
MAFSPITVDLRAWEYLSPAEREPIAVQIDDGMKANGVIQLCNAYLPYRGRELELLARTFFALSPEEKQLEAANPGPPRGWIPEGSDFGAMELLSKDRRPERKEALAFARLEHVVLSSSRWRTPNRQFNAVPELLPAAERAMHDLGNLMLSASGILDDCLEAFERPRIFVPLAERSIDSLNLNLYPKGPAAAETVDVGAHSDYGTLTLLRPGGVSCTGLEVKTTDGWQSVEADADSMLLIAGELTTRWTQGEWPACVHRKLPSDVDSDLMSIVFFRAPRPDLIVPTLQNSDSIDTRPETVGGYLERRLSESASQ